MQRSAEQLATNPGHNRGFFVRGFADLETPPAFLPTVGNNPDMARSPSQRLQLFEELRDRVESGLLSGAPVVTYTVDGQTVSKEPTSVWLAELDNRIADLRRQSSGGLGASRNAVRFRQ